MTGPSYHLLTTLAAVPPGSRVLILGSDSAGHGEPLEALGFTVAQGAASAPASYDWVVAADAGADRGGVLTHLQAAHAALIPGGWVWIAADWDLAEAEALTGLALDAGLALAEAPALETRGPRSFLHGIYRRVNAGTRGETPVPPPWPLPTL